MPTISFEDTIETTKPSTELATATPKTLVPATDLADKGLVGEWTNANTKLPRISLVNKSGQLADVFTPGTWVLSKQHVISELDPKDKKRGIPLRVIALQMLKQYQENISYDDRETQQARLFATAAEVQSVGGQIHYTRGQGFFSEIAQVEFLIQANPAVAEEALDLFYYEDSDGKKYTRAVATFASTAFSGVAVPLATSLRTHLASSGLKGGQWDLGSVIKTNADKSWWGPTIRSAGLVTPAQAEMVKNIG